MPSCIGSFISFAEIVYASRIPPRPFGARWLEGTSLAARFSAKGNERGAEREREMVRVRERERKSELIVAFLLLFAAFCCFSAAFVAVCCFSAVLLLFCWFLLLFCCFLLLFAAVVLLSVAFLCYV